MAGAAVSDETAIVGLQSRYAQAVDDGDVEAIVACFAEDAVAVYNNGGVTLTGAAEIRPFFEAARVELIGPDNPCTHLLGGVVVDLEGDAARSDASMVAFLSRPPGARTMKGLRYRDRLERRPEGWRIVHREHTSHWEHAC
jgi:ketosteroid isomerase-like protein